MKLKVNTGARGNVMPLELFEKIRRSEQIDNSCPVQLVSYSGDHIQTLGETVFKGTFAGKTHNLKSHIIDKAAKPLLGLQDLVCNLLKSRTWNKSNRFKYCSSAADEN